MTQPALTSIIARKCCGSTLWLDFHSVREAVNESEHTEGEKVRRDAATRMNSLARRLQRKKRDQIRISHRRRRLTRRECNLGFGIIR